MQSLKAYPASFGYHVWEYFFFSHLTLFLDNFIWKSHLKMHFPNVFKHFHNEIPTRISFATCNQQSEVPLNSCFVDKLFRKEVQKKFRYCVFEGLKKINRIDNYCSKFRTELALDTVRSKYLKQTRSKIRLMFNVLNLINVFEAKNLKSFGQIILNVYLLHRITAI